MTYSPFSPGSQSWGDVVLASHNSAPHGAGPAPVLRTGAKRSHPAPEFAVLDADLDLVPLLDVGGDLDLGAGFDGGQLGDRGGGVAAGRVGGVGDFDLDVLRHFHLHDLFL